MLRLAAETRRRLRQAKGAESLNGVKTPFASGSGATCWDFHVRSANVCGSVTILNRCRNSTYQRIIESAAGVFRIIGSYNRRYTNFSFFFFSVLLSQAFGSNENCRLARFDFYGAPSKAFRG